MCIRDRYEVVVSNLFLIDDSNMAAFVFSEEIVKPVIFYLLKNINGNTCTEFHSNISILS